MDESFSQHKLERETDIERERNRQREREKQAEREKNRDRGRGRDRDIVVPVPDAYDHAPPSPPSHPPAERSLSECLYQTFYISIFLNHHTVQ